MEYVFSSLRFFQILCDEWDYDYNYMKPHSAFKAMIPAIIGKHQKTFNNTTKLIEEISLN
jgi:hypothetical protein